MDNPKHPRVLMEYYFTFEAIKHIAFMEQSASGDKIRLFLQAYEYALLHGGKERKLTENACKYFWMRKTQNK